MCWLHFRNDRCISVYWMNYDAHMRNENDRECVCTFATLPGKSNKRSSPIILLRYALLSINTKCTFFQLMLASTHIRAGFFLLLRFCMQIVRLANKFSQEFDSLNCNERNKNHINNRFKSRLIRNNVLDKKLKFTLRYATHIHTHKMWRWSFNSIGIPRQIKSLQINKMNCDWTGFEWQVNLIADKKKWANCGMREKKDAQHSNHS